ncbi:MAG TPA: MFS transporter [Caulobacteraceae bacterium]|nr:MFS transporter [Caulobacteraceae bacterium]
MHAHPLSPRVWWTVACAALIVTVAMGVRQAFGLFLRPVSMDLEIGRQAFGMSIALSNLVFGLAQPFVGAWADRHGAGKVVVASTALYVVGLLLTTLATGPLGLNLTFGFLVGLALSGTTFVVVLGAVGRVVPPERRSTAFGIVTAGGSLGQFLVVPAAQGALNALDWQGALVALAALCATMAVLAIGVSGKPVASTGPAGAEATSLTAALKEAAHTRSFWLLNAGFFVCGFHIAFVATHLPAYLRDEGLSESVGAWALALIGLFNILGSWLWGAWGGKLSKKRLLSALYFARAVVIAIFIATPLSPLSVLTFAAAFGFLWLGTVPLTSGLVGQIWGVRYLSTLYGIVFLSHQLGSFLGAWLAGLAFDVTGSYLQMWVASIALGVFAAAIHWPIDERPLVRTPLAPVPAA